MKIGAVIISFNPDLDVLRANVDSLKKQVSQIVIVDNGSRNINEINQLVKNDNINFIYEGKNVGIAQATNDAFSYFQKENYKWIITMDQDSVLPDQAINKYLKYTHRVTGLIASIQKPIKEMTINGRRVTLSKEGTVEYPSKIDKSRKIIASGSLISVEAWKLVGGFDEELFIDAVDFDFNMKLLEAGFSVEQINIEMKHKLGSPVSKIIFGRTIYSFNHSAFRKYYIARNSLIMAKRYNNYSQERKLLFNYFIKILLVEDNKINKIIAFARGLKDGIKYNTGSQQQKEKR